MSGYRDKSKNDYYHSDKPEHGGCLGAFLGFIIIGNIIGIILILIMRNWNQNGPLIWDLNLAYGSSLVSMTPFLSIGTSIATIICAYGLWNWKRWGYYGLIGLFVVAIVSSLFVGSLIGGVSSVVAIAVLLFLMKDKVNSLE